MYRTWERSTRRFQVTKYCLHERWQLRSSPKSCRASGCFLKSPSLKCLPTDSAQFLLGLQKQFGTGLLCSLHCGTSDHLLLLHQGWHSPLCTQKGQTVTKLDVPRIDYFAPVLPSEISTDTHDWAFIYLNVQIWGRSSYDRTTHWGSSSTDMPCRTSKYCGSGQGEYKRGTWLRWNAHTEVFTAMAPGFKSDLWPFLWCHPPSFSFHNLVNSLSFIAMKQCKGQQTH